MDNIETDSEALDYRIMVHEKYSKEDLDTWIMDNLDVLKGMCVLDIGCGTGRHMFTFSKLVGKTGTIVGMDISDESLSKCVIAAQGLGINNLEVYVADLTQLQEKIPIVSFDRILSSFSIYYTKNEGKTFRDIYSLLKDGGIVFICGPGKDNNKEFYNLVKKAGGTFSDYLNKCALFMETGAQKWLSKLFDEVEIVHFDNPIEFPDPETLFAYWKATSLYSKALEPKMRKLIQKEFENGKKFVTTKRVIGLRCKK